MTRILLLSTLLATMSLSLPGQDVPALVRDLKQTTGIGSDPAEFTVYGSSVYFAATTESHGRELYRFDASTGRSTRLTDERPGRLWSSPRNLLVYRDKLYFGMMQSTSWYARYTIDLLRGTAPTLLRDSGGALVPPMKSSGVHGGILYFSGTRDLWRTDGTSAGTYEVKSLDYELRQFTSFRGRLYFVVYDRYYGTARELWSTDGTSTGTKSETRYVAPDHLTLAGDRLYFTMKTVSTGTELAWTDGTQIRLLEVNPGIASSDPESLVAYQGRLYFSAVGKNGPFTKGRELWYTDGTSVTLLKPFRDVTAVRDVTITGPATSPRLIYSAHSATYGRELFCFDGRTSSMANVAPGMASSSPTEFLTASSGMSYFRAKGPAGVELYQTDGTPKGTRLVKDIHTAGDSSPTHLVDWPGTGIVFSADDQLTGREVWITNGTLAGTRRVANVGQEQIAHGLPTQLIDVNGVLYFHADLDGWGLCRSDGTGKGTRKVFPVEEIEERMVLGSKLFFIATPRLSRQDNFLYCLDLRTDQIVKLDLTSDGWPNFARSLVSRNGRAYFYASGDFGSNQRTHGWWSTDGTLAGTRFEGFPFSPLPVVFQGRQYFAHKGYLTGIELWSSRLDGSGRALVFDVRPGSLYSTPRDLNVLGDRLTWFATGGDYSQYDRRLYIWDGIATAPTVVRFGSGGTVSHVRRVGDLVYFAAKSSANGLELYRTDGTVAGTFRVADVWPGGSHGFVRYAGVLNGQLFFVGKSPTTGIDLWRTDGTVAGTACLDLMRGILDSDPGEMFQLGENYAVLGVRRSRAGHELYVTDGTKAGTKLLHDINPGVGDSQPGEFALVDGRLFFAANDGFHGRELFVWRPNGSAVPVGVGCSATGTAPVLTAGVPALGGTHTWSVTGAPKNGTGVIVFGSRARAGSLLSLGGGCDVLVDLSQGIGVVFFQTSRVGTATLKLPIGNDPVLARQGLAIQGAVGPTLTAPLGLDLTNPVQMYPRR